MPPKNFSNPDVLARISALQLRARRVVEGSVSGLHKSPFHGFNVEFAEYREYSPGDDLRRLDWRVLGRTDRYYIKQYEEESNLRATIVLDASRSMQYGTGTRNKWEYAATLAAALATLLISQQDPVGLSLVDHQQRKLIPPAATQAQLMLILEELGQARPDRPTDLGPLLATLSSKLSRRGLVVIISDMLTDLPSFFDAINQLKFRGHELVLFQVLDRDELELPFNDLVQFRDIEGSEEVMAEPWAFRDAYRAAMQTFLDEVRDGCGARGMDHVLMVTDGDLAIALSHYLHSRLRSHHFRG